MSSTPVISAPLVVLGSGIHDYPEHRKRLISECFLCGLAPVVVPPALIPLPEAITCFQQLIAASKAYLGFLAHCYRPRSRIHEDSSIFEMEWWTAIEQNRLRRFFAADLATHPPDPALLLADPLGFSKAVELTTRVQSEEPGFRRFASLQAFADELPNWLAELRSNLGLEAFRYNQRKSIRSEVFVSYAHKDDQPGRP